MLIPADLSRKQWSSAFGARLDGEEPEDLRFRQAKRRRTILVLDQVAEELPLLVQHLRDAFLDGAFCCEPRHENRLALTDAVHPVYRLVLDSRVPPPVKQEDVIGKLQVEADAAGAVTHENDAFAPIVFEHF